MHYGFRYVQRSGCCSGSHPDECLSFAFMLAEVSSNTSDDLKETEEALGMALYVTQGCSFADLIHVLDSLYI